MNQHIDIYCERVGQTFWAEPVNALTNISFFIAAFLAFQFARQQKMINWDINLLLFLLVLIGCGSSLFHTFATKWSALADVLPILLFQIIFIISYSLRVMDFKKWQMLLLLFVFFSMIVSSSQLPAEWLNGSFTYFPALICLLGFGLYHFITHQKERPILLIAAFIFIVSLFFRSIDMVVCSTVSLGTHFIWHILNGVTLYLSLRGLVRGINPSS